MLHINFWNAVKMLFKNWKSISYAIYDILRTTLASSLARSLTLSLSLSSSLYFTYYMNYLHTWTCWTFAYYRMGIERDIQFGLKINIWSHLICIIKFCKCKNVRWSLFFFFVSPYEWLYINLVDVFSYIYFFSLERMILLFDNEVRFMGSCGKNNQFGARKKRRKKMTSDETKKHGFKIRKINIKIWSIDLIAQSNKKIPFLAVGDHRFLFFFLGVFHITFQ